MAKITKVKDIDLTQEVVESKEKGQLLFDKTNYMIVAIGIVMIIIGFVMMSGGGSDDRNVFDADAVYSARRITLAPILVIGGLVVNILAILKKPA